MAVLSLRLTPLRYCIGNPDGWQSVTVARTKFLRLQLMDRAEWRRVKLTSLGSPFTSGGTSTSQSVPWECYMCEVAELEPEAIPHEAEEEVAPVRDVSNRRLAFLIIVL